ncbi:MAG TPA: NIPSNAP family protein [Bryobacteraceae bacterium]|nr:NIPSNAP family protein [Bryobacteraceae bacterium]
MTKSHALSFILGAAAALGLTMAVTSDAQSPHHVYELRMYHANPGKLDALVARFRDHTETIFKRHNIHAIGYWIPEDNKDNLLIYIVDHKSKEDATKNWAAFQADDEWKKVRTESETNGALQNKVDSVYMDPTDFSRLK